MNMGGGRGNGQNFQMDEWESFSSTTEETDAHSAEIEADSGPSGTMPDMNSRQMPGGMGSSDVSLIYSDDEYSSYSNIFDNAKTDITDTDKDRSEKH